MHKTNTGLVISSLCLGNLIYIFSAILLLLTLLSSSILTSFYVSADDSVVDEINITVPVSCTLSGTGMNTHTAEIGNGLYRADIGTTTLKAFCNDNEGFAIYAAGYTGNEIGATNSNKLVGTTTSGNATIDTGLATSTGNTDISNWAMKLTASSDSGDTTGTNALTIDSAPNLMNGTPTGANASFSQYHTVPNEYTKVAHKNSATDMNESTGGATLTSTYAAYISKTQPADTYSGQVIYTLVHPSYANSDGCNPDATTIDEAICMQDFAGGNADLMAASMILEKQYILKDKRDNKMYTVARYPAGTDSTTGETLYNIWMTKNLDLDLDPNKTYTNDDTDLGYNPQTRLYETASWTPARATYAPNNYSWGLYDEGEDVLYGDTRPESYDPGDLYWDGTFSNLDERDEYYGNCEYDTDTPVCDETLNPISTHTTSAGIPQYHLGNYYNWTAAIAKNDSSSITQYNTIVEQSICPAGWTLPRAYYDNMKDSIYALWSQYGFEYTSIYGANALWLSPLFFVASGVKYSPPYKVEEFGRTGFIWSSVVVDSYEARAGKYDAYGDSPYPGMNNSRFSGGSIRCIARPVSSSLEPIY